MTPGRIVTPGDLAALEVQQVAEKPGAHDLRLDRHRMARDRDLVDVPVGLAIAAGDVLEELAGGRHRLAQHRKSVVSGKSVSVRVELRGRRRSQKKKQKNK